MLKLPSVIETLSKMDEGKRATLVRTVQLFAYGTVKEYYELKQQKDDQVWTLNDAQLEKLRMLSVVSIARSQIDGATTSSSGGEGGGDVEMMATDSISNTAPTKNGGRKKKKNKKGGRNGDMLLSISYAKLASELHIPDDDGSTYNEKDHMRTLEDLLIQCIYSNIIAAKLDQSSRSLKVEPSVSLMPESISGSGGKDGNVGGVYGSIFSRDMDTSTPESINVEVSRMISTLEHFLKQSNAVLATLEHSSAEVASDRKMDELRWHEVQKHIEESPSKLREAASAGEGAYMRGGGDPMDVVDMAGRRQVKRSKGGHSMMMGQGWS